MIYRRSGTFLSCAWVAILIFLFPQEQLKATSVPITSLNLEKLQQGYGTPEIDLAVDKHPLTIDGIAYPHGLGTHADSYFSIKLGKGSSRFTSLIGVDDEAGDSLARVKFIIFGDDRVLWQSDDMTYHQLAKSVSVDVTGIDSLVLCAVGTGDGIRFDHVDWINPMLEVDGASPEACDFEGVEQEGILTPPVPLTPRINGPSVFGVRPGSPFLYSVPVSGERPMEIRTSRLPTGLQIDTTTGEITGSLSKVGTYGITLFAKNALGSAAKPFEIRVGDQIALSPPMGWSSWNCWMDNINQNKILATAHALTDLGLNRHGFSYVNIDDGWQGGRNIVSAEISPNIQRFPNLKEMVAEIHDLGLKAGIYSTPWVTSYDGYVGGSSDNQNGTWNKSMTSGPKNEKIWPFSIGKYHFFSQDARAWAAWGFDYLKFDWCPNESPETIEMSEALNHTGRDIVLSLSNNSLGTLFSSLPGIAPHANLWRISGDINDSWSSLIDNAFNKDAWAPFNRPGNYNDPDMMVIGYTFGHPSRLTHNEQYTHMGLWCLLSAPLILGCDLQRMDDFTTNLLTNDEVINIDQDRLCAQATIASRNNPGIVYAKSLADGGLAVGLINLGPLTHVLSISWQDLKISGTYKIRDLWRQADLGLRHDSFSCSVGPHGIALIRMEKVPY